MARRRGGGGSRRSTAGGGGWFSKPKPAARPPARQQQAPAPVPIQRGAGGGGLMSGLAGTVVQGAAFGTGSAIAHRAVGAVAGGIGGEGAPPPEGYNEQMAPPAAAQQNTYNACVAPQQAFLNCLSEHNNDISACQVVFDEFKRCQQGMAQQM